MKRKKRILKLFAVAAAILFICVMVSSFAVVEKAQASETYILGYGETLWELYEDFGNGITWDRWYKEVKDINGKEYGEEWYAGEEITLLIYK